MKTFLKWKILTSVTVLLALFMLFLQSCQKDLDKVASPDLNPTFALPVINSELTLGNLLTPDSTLIFDTLTDDRVEIKVVYREDSLFSVDIGEVFELPDNEGLTENYSVGGISIDDVSLHAKATLDQLLGSLNQAAADTLEAHDGEVHIFPPMTLEDTYTFDTDPFDNFQQVTFSEGSMNITFSNNFPVTLTDLQFDISNAENDTLIKSFTLDTIDPGETATVPFNLAGKTLPNNINAGIIDFNSPGSNPDEVLINLQDSIAMDMAIINATVISGEAQMEAQQVISDTTTFAINPGNDAEIENLILSKAKIDYTFNSEIPVAIEMTLNLPSSNINGNTPQLKKDIPAFGSIAGTWDLDGIEMDLTQDPDTAYNRLQVEYEVNTMASNGIVTIDSADFIAVDLLLSDMEFEFVDGYFGTPEVIVDEDALDLGIDFFDNIEGGLTLTNPYLNFSYSNSIGVPILVDFNFSGNTNEGESVDLAINMPDLPQNAINFNAPQNPGEIIQDTIVIDRNNSNLVDLIALPPEEVIYSGTAVANGSAPPHNYNFASSDSKFTLGVDMDLPLQFRTGLLVVQDTVDLDLDEDFDENIEAVSLKLHAVNRFPFSADIELDMFDNETNTVIDSLRFTEIIKAGESDPVTFRITEPGISDLDLPISKTSFENMIDAEQMIIRINITTFSFENQSVKLYTDNSVQIFVGVEAKLKTE